MKPIELLYFEDVNPFHEAVFAFPIIGKLSMRQMLIIGASAIVSWTLYQGSGNLSSIIPLLLGSYVGLKKFNVRPIESQIISIIKFMFFEQKIKQRKIVKQFNMIFEKHASSKLGPSKLFQPKLRSVNKEIKTREIITDPLKPIRMQIKLVTPDQRPISNTQTRIELDGNVISTLTTNNNGEIEVLIIPKTLGEKRLLIFAQGSIQPVFEESLLIRNS